MTIQFSSSQVRVQHPEAPRQIDASPATADVRPAALAKDEVGGARPAALAVARERLSPPSPPSLKLTAAHLEGAEVFASTIAMALDDVVRSSESGSDADAWSNPDVLVAVFLKLGIMDPNNSVETHQKLHTLASSFRGKALVEARVKSIEARVTSQEAEITAEINEKIMPLVNVLTLLITLLITVLSLGTAGPVMFALIAFLATLQVGIATGGAVMNKQAADASADASEANNSVERTRAQAQREQAVVEEEAEIIKQIIESKNALVDAVAKMMKASFATNQKIMSAAMSR